MLVCQEQIETLTFERIIFFHLFNNQCLITYFFFPIKFNPKYKKILCVFAKELFLYPLL